MKILKSTMILALLMGLVLAMSACSGGSAPVNPDLASAKAPDTFGTKVDEGNIVAVYDAVIDPEMGTFTITPTDRIGSVHLPLSLYYPNVLKIVGYGWTPNFWADMKLTHPYPGSGINGFDARVIGIVPANAGVSFTYPAFAVNGNNMVVMEPDGYTRLFDGLGGSIPGNVNPFKAYFKSTDHRVWASTGTTTETQRWQMKLTGFGGPLVYKLVVDVSTNYPAPPTPVTDNAKEPVDMSCVVGAGLTPTGGSATVTVTLLDWQGPTSTTCQIEAPALFTGLITLPYVGPGPNPDTYIFGGPISNSMGATPGTYPVMIAAFDNSTQVYMYRESSAEVKAVTTSKVKSTAFTGIYQGDTWFDIGVAPNSYVYVVADHPDTLNTESTRTIVRYNNDLSNLVILSPGMGMNYGITNAFLNRVDVTSSNYFTFNVAQQFQGIWTADAAGNTTDLAGDAYYVSCGSGILFPGIQDVWQQNTSYDGSSACAYEQIPVEECGAVYDCGNHFPDSNPTSTGFLFTYTNQIYTQTEVVGVNGIDGTNDALFFVSGAAIGKLSRFGDFVVGGGTPVEITTAGSYGTGDQEFKGGKDVAIDAQGNILTLETHDSGQSRFQKFTSSLVWVYTTGWQDSGVPMRMDFDQGDNMLYILCDNGIHICSVE